MKVDVTTYWLSPPPKPSAQLQKWTAKIQAGWKPNRRLRSMGYEEAADYYGVYIWEYLNVLMKLLP